MKSWKESRKDCKAKGADLVIINSKEEQEFIIKQLDKLETWIGLSDTVKEGEWKWVDDTPLNTGSWARGEPNNAGKQKCFSFSSSFYIMSNEMKNWEESRKDCKAKGADLVIINSKEEQEFIVKQLDKLETWIGLSDTVKEGEWKWVDDTPLNTGYWAQGEPNNRGDEDCAVIYTYPSHLTATWNDRKCSAKLPWICEKDVSQ
ncbi:hypothetical protein Q7C36_001652 [Tachysurus vachellii]|uniref:C-type lectin domain-containing protein n=1 Tax=Tachysurus vachellii TaxID=175792 RepID=A0AA88TFV2_TACVA|nr:hypothetical protein Q7C36_001652 [Tachysurus vachellii]